MNPLYKIRNLPFLLLFVFPLTAKVNIITSIPDIADIAENIGGDSVNVFSLARGTENMHFVPARSSFLPKINRAHLVLCLGLEAENAWLPFIVRSSRNKWVKKGNPGWIEVYEGLNILERPEKIERHAMTKKGAHRLGNPHYNNGPNCGKIMAKNIYRAIAGIDTANADYYVNHYKKFLNNLNIMEKRLLKKGAPLKGIHVITYHADLSYMCKFYGMNLTGCLEPKPGLPPTTSHLIKLIKKARKDDVKLVLYHQAQNPGLPKKVANKTGAQLVCFANMVHSRKEIKTYIQLQEYNLQIMLDALIKASGK